MSSSSAFSVDSNASSLSGGLPIKGESSSVGFIHEATTPEDFFFIEVLELVTYLENGDYFLKESDDINWSKMTKLWERLEENTKISERKVADLVDSRVGQPLLSWLLRIEGTPTAELITIIQKLINTSINSLMKKDKDGMIPLHYACIYHREKDEIIKLLLSADVNKKTLFQRNCDDEKSPLHLACEYGASKEIISLLLHRDSSDDKTVPSFVQRMIYEEDEYGKIPLHIACDGAASPDVVKILLEVDVENNTIHKTDEYGSLPLHIVCKVDSLLTGDKRRKGYQNTIATIKMIRDKDSNHQTYKVRDSNGKEPLQYIASVELMSDMIEDALDGWDLNWMEFLLTFSSNRIFSDALVQNLKNDTCIYWLTHMSCERNTIFALMLRLYCHVIWMVAFVASSILFVDEKHDSKSEWQRLLAFLLLPTAIIFIAIELLNLRQLYRSNTLGFYFLNGWNWLDISTISLVLVSAYYLILNDIDPSNYNIAALFCITATFQLLHFLSYLRQVSLPFAIFVGGLLQILRALIPFLIILTLILVIFAFMYHILDSTGADRGESFKESIIKMFLMLFTGPEELSHALDVAYGFFIFIILLNGVVLAVVSNKWADAAEESSILFWQYRLHFIQETRSKKRIGDQKTNAISFFDDKFDNLLDLEDFREFLKSREESVSTKVWTCLVVTISFFLGFFTFGLLWCMPIREIMFVGSSQQNLSKNDSNKKSEEKDNNALEKKVKELENTIVKLHESINNMQDMMFAGKMIDRQKLKRSNKNEKESLIELRRRSPSPTRQVTRSIGEKEEWSC